MKKYTNKILVTGLLILAVLFIGFFVYVFHWLKNGSNENQDINDPMLITSATDEDGNMKVTAEHNGKTIVIDPNTGTYEEVTTEINSTFSDTTN